MYVKLSLIEIWKTYFFYFVWKWRWSVLHCIKIHSLSLPSQYFYCWYKISMDPIADDTAELASVSEDGQPSKGTVFHRLQFNYSFLWHCVCYFAIVIILILASNCKLSYFQSCLMDNFSLVCSLAAFTV